VQPRLRIENYLISQLQKMSVKVATLLLYFIVLSKHINNTLRFILMIKNQRETVKLTSHFHLAPMLRISGSIPPFVIYVLIVCIENFTCVEGMVNIPQQLLCPRVKIFHLQIRNKLFVSKEKVKYFVPPRNQTQDCKARRLETTPTELRKIRMKYSLRLL
jgi:hypothetical protein